MTGRDDDVARRVGSEDAGVGAHHDRLLAPAEPERSRRLLVEARTPAGPAALHDQGVLTPRGDLADHHRPDGTTVELELHQRGVLIGAVGEHATEASAEARDPAAADELDKVEPVRADVGERPGRTPGGGIEAPVGVVGLGEPVLEVRAVHQVEVAELARGHARAAARGSSGGTGTRTAPRRTVPAACCASTSASADAGSRVKGFSQSTCLPCASAVVASCAWSSLGTHRCTTSTSGSVTSASADANARSAPRRAAASLPRSGVEAATPTNRAPARRAARGVRGPDEPHPHDPRAEL